MDKQSNKAARLEQIEQLLLRHKEGLTLSEIARHVGVNRSTVWRYYQDADLPGTRYIMGEDKRLRLNPAGLHFNVKLDLDEALALHLAVRLFSTRMDRHNPAAASAIRKISRAIDTMAPAISRAMAQSADRADGDDQLQDANYIGVLKTLTRAWAEGRPVRLWYASDPSSEDHEYDFCPFFVEPYAIGMTTYVIGKLAESGEMRTLGGEMRTFKIERIRRVDLLPGAYTIPADFEADAFLGDAWGIWTSEDPPKEVVLRFSARVARRVKETRWHRSQTIEDQPDGSVVWRALIAAPQEMMPWVRSWGDEVEIIAI